MVGEQQLEHAFLRALGGLGRGRHDLTLGDGSHARHDERLAARSFDLDDALAAHTDRRHARVVAEVRDERPRLLAGVDQQLTGFGLDRTAVDGDADRGLRCCGVGHRGFLGVTRGVRMERRLDAVDGAAVLDVVLEFVTETSYCRRDR